jgi:hypothetical protein
MTSNFSISVSSLSASYSNDFVATSGSYIWNVGNFASDGISSFPTVSGYSPWVSVKIVPTLTGPGSYTFSTLRFNFSDTYNDATIVTPYSAISATGLTHIFSVPGYYPITMTVTSDLTGHTYSTYQVAKIRLTEIAPIVSMSVKNLSGGTVTSSTTANSPETLVFSTSATRAGSFPIESIRYDMGDDTIIFANRYDLGNSATNAFYPDLTDPRNQTIVHTFRRNQIDDPTTFFPMVSVVSKVTASTASPSASYTVGPLYLANKIKKRLLRSKMYGFEDDLLLIFEDDSGQVFLHSIQDLKALKNDSVIQFTF